MKIKSKTVRISDRAYILQNYLTQIDRNGNYSNFAQYAVNSASSRQAM